MYIYFLSGLDHSKVLKWKVFYFLQLALLVLADKVQNLNLPAHKKKNSSRIIQNEESSSLW